MRAVHELLPYLIMRAVHELLLRQRDRSLSRHPRSRPRTAAPTQIPDRMLRLDHRRGGEERTIVRVALILRGGDVALWSEGILDLGASPRDGGGSIG